jgi:PAS domain S-box-containing protein
MPDAARQVDELELRKVRKDGSMLWVRETARAVLPGGEPVVLIPCEDITERKDAEEKIREQEIELRQTFNLTPCTSPY